jgi:hypothetical protein
LLSRFIVGILNCLPERQLMIISEPALFFICADSDPAPIANVQRYSTANAGSVANIVPNNAKARDSVMMLLHYKATGLFGKKRSGCGTVPGLPDHRQRRYTDRRRCRPHRNREGQGVHRAGRRDYSSGVEHLSLLEPSHSTPSSDMALLHALGKHALKMMGALGETGSS